MVNCKAFLPYRPKVRKFNGEKPMITDWNQACFIKKYGC
jgi:hypothetical protein